MVFRVHPEPSQRARMQVGVVLADTAAAKMLGPGDPFAGGGNKRNLVLVQAARLVI